MLDKLKSIELEPNEFINEYFAVPWTPIICSGCKEEKSIEHIPKGLVGASGYRDLCRDCIHSVRKQLTIKR